MKTTNYQGQEQRCLFPLAFFFFFPIGEKRMTNLASAKEGKSATSCLASISGCSRLGCDQRPGGQTQPPEPKKDSIPHELPGSGVCCEREDPRGSEALKVTAGSSASQPSQGEHCGRAAGARVAAAPKLALTVLASGFSLTSLWPHTQTLAS